MHLGRAGVALTGGVIAVVLLPGLSASASSWSLTVAAASHGEARARTVPGTPTGLTETCNGNASITLAWTAPVLVAGAAPVTSYTVYGSVNGGGYQTAATGVTATTLSMSGLAAGTYTGKVTAYTGTNWAGTVSAASTSRTIASGGACS